MTKLRLELTQKCNFSCIFCHNDQISEKCLNKLTAEDYGFLVKTAKNIGINYCVLSGGEPLTRPDINDIIEEIYNHNIYLQITTNGYLLDKVSKPQLIDGLNISLHSTDLVLHKKITGQNFALPNIIKNIEFLNKNYKIKIKINIVALKNLTITQQNLKSLLNLCTDYKLDLKIIELLDNQNSEFITIEEVKNFLISIGFKAKRNIGRSIFLNNGRTNIILQKCFCQFAKEQLNPNILCHQFNDLFVLPSGKISCCRLKNSSINILQEIQDRDEDALKIKLKKAINLLGKDCPLKK